MGATGSDARFRPARLTALDLPAGLECRFVCDGRLIGPLPVIDLSTTGLGIATRYDQSFEPGSNLESLQLLLRGNVLWEGEGVVVHGSEDRIGGRFTSGVVDLRAFAVEATLDERISLLEEQKERLPAEWRAAVADLRQLVEEVRVELDGVEGADIHDPLRRLDEEAKLFKDLRSRWGAKFYESIAALHELSKHLDARGVELGRGYASSMLMPLLMACALQRRAYEKPLGYAGDYRMMELCFAREPLGEGLFSRFLHSIGQNYTLVRSVVARELVMRSAVRQAAETQGSGPVRILALAAGPAIELRRWLEETPMLERPVELTLLDQDPYAHESAHRDLTRILLESHHGMLPVTVRCLYFSVRQLLKPTTPDEQRIRDSLGQFDLIYSAGLYDYLPDLVATRLTMMLYSKLKEGGRMLLGNLMETPDSTWMMEYVLGWTLLYRTEAAMLRFGERLNPAPSGSTITLDGTRRCVFLDVVR